MSILDGQTDTTTPIGPDPNAPTPGPDPYADTAAILQRVDKLEKRWSAPRPRRPFLMASERNIRFLQGDQWIRPALGGAIGWRPANLKKDTPTPVTNKYAEVTKAFSSMLSRFEPALTYRPASEDPEDMATSEVADRVVEVIQDEVKMVPIRQSLANWVTHTGGAWLETGYDPSPDHGMVEIPMHVCPMCHAEQPLAPMLPMPDGVPAVDALGNAPDPMGGPLCEDCQVPMAEQMVSKPRGAMFVDIVNVFEMLFDFTVTDPSKHRGFIRKKSLDVEVAKARWPEIADQITADSLAGGFLTSDGLALITPNLDDAGPLRYQQYGTGAINNRVTETWYWQLPDETYPDGLLSISVGRGAKLSAYVGPLPYYAVRDDGTKKYFLPFVFFAQELIPGSAWPRTVMNDVALKQAQRNQWESMVMQAGFKMANHVWLIPNGSNVQQLTGDMGLVINWNALGSAGNAEPKRIQGLPVPQSFYEQIDRIDAAIEGLAHTLDVLRGARPPGVTAGITLQILKERGESLFGPMFVLWHNSWAEWAQQAVEIFRLFATEPRLRQVMGKNGKWKVEKFMAADLQGRVDVVPEAGMSLPRSTMTDRAEIEQVVAMGAVNVMDPETNYQILKHYGKLSLRPTLKADEQNAAIEDEAFVALGSVLANEAPATLLKMRQFVSGLQAQNVPPPMILAQVEQQFAQFGVPTPILRPTIDDNAVHARDQRAFAKTEEYRALPPIVQYFVELHIAAHDFLVGQAMLAAQQARQGTTAGANMLQRPGPQPGSPPSTTAERGGSSQNRMDGDNAEMERRAGQPVG